jgi:4a-hydroxytetrahydrobiopterin dehydratase
MDEPLTRQAASDAVGDDGWRFLLGTLRTTVPVSSLPLAASVATAAVAACGPFADDHLHADLRADRVVLSLRTASRAPGVGRSVVTARDADLAGRITAAVHELGLPTEPSPLQAVEIAIDALDIPAVRPFWQAVLAYTRVGDDLADPAGQSPRVWFQPMDAPRPQRNRIHLDICVPHDQAADRLAAALAAGGTLVSAERAPAFWVLADPEGNEACITTWQGRDPPAA